MPRIRIIALLAALIALSSWLAACTEHDPVKPVPGSDDPFAKTHSDTFTLRAYALDSVYLAGTVNNWSTQDPAWQLTLDADGYTWRLITDVPDGLISYKFIIRKGAAMAWLTDPSAVEVDPGGGSPSYGNAVRGRTFVTPQALPQPLDRARLVIYETNINELSSTGSFAGAYGALTSGANLADLGVMDEYGLPTNDYAQRLESLSMDEVRHIRSLGRQEMNEVLATRKDQYGNPIAIPESATVFDFKRRFARYKRPDMIFDDPTRLAALLEEHDAHFVLTGKPHPMDEEMKGELTRLLQTIDENDTLRARVHYVQDYDEQVGRALSVGADCAINVPVVGQEACGTSFMKDIANFKVLISTADGGVADVEPIACLEVEDDEINSLYEKVDEAARIVRDDEHYRQLLMHQLKGYAPVFSGARMMGQYMELFARLDATR